jgi:group I intron endonuclease
MPCIYKITNIVTQDFYVGKTKLSAEDRFKEHIKQHQRRDTFLYRAMRKYGKDNFLIETLETTDESLLNEKEKQHILELSPRYNMTQGGDGGNAFISISDELRQKFSRIRKGAGNPMYGKRGKDNPNFGKKRGESPLISKALKNPCVCEGVMFPSIGEAEAFYKGKHCVRKRLDNPKYPDWYRLVPKTARK